MIKVALTIIFINHNQGMVVSMSLYRRQGRPMAAVITLTGSFNTAISIFI